MTMAENVSLADLFVNVAMMACVSLAFEYYLN
jgi:hypothetical protein